jgi:hypothetical protein
MNDCQIEMALDGLIAITGSNFPSDTDIVLSTSGRNSASVRIPLYAMRELFALAKKAKEDRAKTEARA